MGVTFMSQDINPDPLLNKKTLALHSLTEAIFKLDLEKYNLTLNDGLFSHYYYFDILKKINTSKIFYIISGAIDTSLECRPMFDGSHLSYVSEDFSINQWKENNNKENFMTLGELKYLLDNGAMLGAHSHMHEVKYGSDCFLNFLAEFEHDCVNMLDWFKTHLSYVPNKYAFPYSRMYTSMNCVVNVHTGIASFEYGNSVKKIEGTRYSEVYRVLPEDLI